MHTHTRPIHITHDAPLPAKRENEALVEGGVIREKISGSLADRMEDIPPRGAPDWPLERETPPLGEATEVSGSFVTIVILTCLTPLSYSLPTEDLQAHSQNVQHLHVNQRKAPHPFPVLSPSTSQPGPCFPNITHSCTSSVIFPTSA